jgi:hypothetical protein
MRTYDNGMSETWTVLQFVHHDKSFVGSPFNVMELLTLDHPPAAGVDLPLPRGGWVEVLWVDAKHHFIGVERSFTHGHRKER